MSKSRSQFYVDTPPTQRHSMYVTPNEVGAIRQDLSSSSNTLPSSSGSVDRLTEKNKKKETKKFFTLKPKNSFPFFSSSTTSLSKRKGSKRDSYVQTDVAGQTYEEVGVQTQSASTVDVPVQTSLEWAEGEALSYRQKTQSQRPTFRRWPSLEYKPGSYVSPLLPSKLVKYAAPDVPTLASSIDGCVNTLTPSADDSPPRTEEERCRPASVTTSAVVHPDPTLTPRTEKRLSAPEHIQSEPSGKQLPPVADLKPDQRHLSPGELKPTREQLPPVVAKPFPEYSTSPGSKPIHEHSLSFVPNKIQEHTEPISLKPVLEPALPVILKNSNSSLSSNEADKKKESTNFHSLFSHSPDRPSSALKCERTDSPGKSRPKTVHFEISDSKEISPPKVEPEPILRRNLDKEFIALLRDFDILPDDYVDNTVDTTSSTIGTVPKPNLLFPTPDSVVPHQDYLPVIPEKSAETAGIVPKPNISCPVPSSEVPLQDHLPSIPENSAETSETDAIANANEPALRKDENKSESDSKVNTLQPNVNNVCVIETPKPTIKKDVIKSNIDDGTDGFVKPTSSNEIEGPELDPCIEAHCENVYDALIKENIEKSSASVSLPTLPSFFEPTPKYTEPYCGEVGETCPLELNLESSPAVIPSFSEANIEENMLSRSSSRSSLRSNPSVEFEELLDSAKKFDSCENLDQLEEEIIRSLCQPDSALDEVEVNEFVPISTDSPVILSNDATELRRNIIDRLLSCENEENIVPNQTKKPVTPRPSLESLRNRPKSKKGKKYVATITKMEDDTTINGNINQNAYITYPSPNTSDSFKSLVLNNAKVSLSTETNTSCIGERDPSTLGVTDVQNPILPSTNPLPSPTDVLPNPKPTREPTCDFTNCVKPSMLHNSPFAAKMNSSPVLSSPVSTPVTPDSKTSVCNSAPKPTGQCDFGSCLKPSQVHNSLFTDQLSEITANKSSSISNDPFTSNNPSMIRARSPVPFKPVVSNSNTIRKIKPPELKPAAEDPFQHRTEITITLGPPQKTFQESKSITPFELQQDIRELDRPSSLLEESMKTNNLVNVIPQPPPLPDKKRPLLLKSNSLQSCGPKMAEGFSSVPCSPTQKSSVVFQPQTQPQLDYGDYRISANADFKEPSDENDTTIERRNENFQNTNNNVTSNTYQNGYRSLSPKSNINVSSHKDIVLSPSAVVTDAPPPPGAVLLDQKVTVEGDKIHTDKYYAIPVKEVLKETTSTTKFIPAPPKYEGIGPTEDGIPIGLRNSVKKENMHNWYKSMYKSLHKADLSNDGQEYIVGYISDPEMHRKDNLKTSKSATLDNRQVPKTNGSFYKDGYPASAKSSIDVYNVRPRLIEDYEPGYSSVTDNEITIGSKRFLPSSNVPKTKYEFKNGYEPDNHFIRNLDQPDTLSIEQQKTYYKEIQHGGDIPQFGLGKPAPEKLKEPVLGPLPMPPINYQGPTSPKAVRPLSHPLNYTSPTDNNYLSTDYEIQMKQTFQSEFNHNISPTSSSMSSPARVKSPSRSPDLKVPARALFDFKTESHKELPLKKGDFIQILRQLDKNWYEGERQGRIGIFPVDYVEVVPPEHVSTPVMTYSEGVGKILFDFKAHSSLELSVKKGDTISLLRRVDSNWYDARLNSIRGIVPVSYIQVLQEPTEKNATLRSPKSNSSSPRNSSETRSPLKSSPVSPVIRCHSPVRSSIANTRLKQSPRRKRGSGLVEPVMYKALYSYTPQNTDELELLEGDSVCVVEMCDDGWFVGTSVRTGTFGIFPGNYVEKGV